MPRRQPLVREAWVFGRQRKNYISSGAFGRAHRRHAATVEQWDSDPWLLNTPDGTVDLRSGILRPPRWDEYITKSTTVGPGSNEAPPLWLAFLRRVFDGDETLAEFAQCMAGYALTGVTREHAMFFPYGSGGNGKGTFIMLSP